MIKAFTQILGFIFIGLILHEAYHWVFAVEPTKACYVAGKGFAVYSKSGTDEVVPYVILFSSFVLGTVISLRTTRRKGMRKTTQKQKNKYLKELEAIS